MSGGKQAYGDGAARHPGADASESQASSTLAPPVSAYLGEALEADVHKEIYSVAIAGLLRSRGDKGSFAASVGMSERTLRAFLDPEDPKRPGEGRARRMVAAFAIPWEQRDDLLEHIVLANERRLRRRRELLTRVIECPPPEIVMDLRQAHHAATFAKDPVVSRARYEMVSEESMFVLHHMDARRDPVTYVELCLVAHDALCVLNRPIRALYYAKLAQDAVARINGAAARQDRERIGNLVVNAMEAEAVVYRNVGLYQRAYQRTKATLEWMQRNRVDDFVLKTYTTIGLLHALAGLPRFVLYEADTLADQVRRMSEASSDPIAPLIDLRAREAQVRAYVSYGAITTLRARKAQALLAPAVETMGQLPLSGDLHEVIALATLAWLRYAMKDSEGWTYYVRRALALATTAGLSHQVAKIRAEYKNVLQDSEDA